MFRCSNSSTKVWRLENINNNETEITVEENTLSLSPDCSTESVSIYSGEYLSIYHHYRVISK